MISRFFARWLILWVFMLLMYQISDVTPQLRSASHILKSKSETIAIIPVTITASRRDYPSVVENRGKWFVYSNRLYTARHVVADSGYNYFINWSIPLTSLYHLSWDLGSAAYSWTVDLFAKLTYLSWSDRSEVLVWQYRDDHWNWLTRLIVSSGDEWIIIDLPVLPGDSGSPVIFSDQTLWVVSQSHSWNQAIVQKI
jgi:hypothetical protein